MKVKLAYPTNRPIQLRYTCPETGKEKRVSTGTRNKAEALQQRDVLQAKLTLGITTEQESRRVFGPQMPWDDFRDEYHKRHVVSLSERSQEAVQSRLSLAEKIVRPRTLSDMAQRQTLIDLRESIAKGLHSRFNRPRSPQSTRSYMVNVLAALNWAVGEGWLEAVPVLPKQRMPKVKVMKGRPITGEEFDRMVQAVPKVVDDPEPWVHVLHGLLTSGLRLGELMSVKWNAPDWITPSWDKGRYGVLCIPHHLQKNETEEDIPLLPDFEKLLLQTAENDRFGFAFNPTTGKGTRPTSAWVGKQITAIGKAAGVIVDPGKRGAPPKYASAHDLRRTCATRLADAGVPDRVLMRVMRHEDISTTRKFYAPGTVQREAAVLHDLQVYPESLGTLANAE